MTRKTRLSMAIVAGGLLAGAVAVVGIRPIIGPRIRPLTARRFEATPARLARGRYLASSGVAPCVMCHSPLVPKGPEFEFPAGQEFSGRSFASDGVPFLTAPNLTPDPETGIGNWSDDQIARAVREGISHDGRALFPIMPYEKFRRMSDEDLASVIVYLRSLPPVRHVLTPSRIPFPLNRLINGVPQPIAGTIEADRSTPEKRGEYIATLAACADCHTPRDNDGHVVASMPLAGGTVLHFDGRPDITTANITPGVNGIPYYTESLFIETMRTGRVRERTLDALMPTMVFRNMTDADLKDLFAYLRSVKPIDHFVDKSLPPTMCPVCGLRHGGGERNRAG